MQNNKNIILATTLSMLILLGWTWFYEKPRIEAQEAQKAAAISAGEQTETTSDSKRIAKSKPVRKKKAEALVSFKDRKDILKKSRRTRVEIKSDKLHGSISLVGARFDDLTLAQYFDTINKEKEVVLFSPAKSKKRYFADFGFISSDANLQLPNPKSVWKSDSMILTPNNPITLSWRNRAGVKFLIHVALDENYMFDITKEIVNNSPRNISVASYGRINRVLNNPEKGLYILHEGPIGVLEDILQEVTYNSLIEDKEVNFKPSKGGWLGMTDKYWFSSIIPDESLKYDASFTHNYTNHNGFFNTEFIGQEFIVEKRDSIKFNHRLFAGAKKVGLLDNYEKEYNIKLFDRAIDFGWFYFLTKPFYFMIAFLNKFLGNFGLAILVMTVFIKAALFPMANKSYGAIAKVKTLAPKVDEIRKRLKDDKVNMNREIMALYKREKVNPASGCLPILLQIPIFFALYKVIFVTLDMRHAPFYGWIKDLSAPDPTSIFNLFGLLPFEVSGPFGIGIWPILMGITMVIQQKISPQAADPTQQKVLKWMPYIFTFILAAFPAGLVIYWTWSNTLSVAQQWFINKKHNA